jgi:hypothetical protein
MNEIKENISSADKYSTGLTLEGDSGEEVVLRRFTSLSRWSKAKFKSPCNFKSDFLQK